MRRLQGIKIFKKPTYLKLNLSQGFFETFIKTKKYSSLLIFESLGEILLISLFVFLGYGLFGAILASLCIKIALFLLIYSKA